MLVHILEGYEMKRPKVLSSLNIDRAEHAKRYGLACKDPSLARQDQKDEADINRILELFGVTGVLPVSVRLPEYGDFDGISDYREAIEAVRAAEAAFAAVPAKLRDRLQNNPQKFLEFCADPANLPELRELGLAPGLPPAATAAT